ncbi:HNH endonuclease [Sphingosinicella sp.]|uniref:HNH endonuclease n=1 Tax=Sphingosinicella sp. TaxID=1917971 RepID=UPI0035B17ADD
MTDLVHYSPKHRVVKRNVLCAYCGITLEPFKGGEEEHVIGRRFVPKGTLAGQWNLIVRSCPACNDAKADLEDDLSAITMQPDGLGRFAADDDRLRAEAVRKARTRNRRTQQRVSEPTPPLIVKGNFGPANITFSYTAPAQADDRRMFELARLQLVGFFSMLTYDEAAKRGYFWTGQYAPVVVARQEDWGNPRLLWIDAVSRDWEYRLHAIAADGFYRVWIRRHLGEPAVWAWAIEWNRNFRLAGFFGDPEAIAALLGDLPKLDIHTIHEGPDRWLRMRTEQPLADDDDVLFDAPLSAVSAGAAA